VSHGTGRKRQFREIAERHLMLDAMQQVGARYPGAQTRAPALRSNWFWSRLFVPVYRRVPWELKQRAMQMTGMTASGWTPPPRQPGQPWQPPTPKDPEA
jgi:hypothetical protein